MIVQQFTIHPWDWKITIYYAVSSTHPDVVLAHLRQIGCRGSTYRGFKNELLSGVMDHGLTFSNPKYREVVSAISPTTSAAQFANTFDHEKGHIVDFIASSMGIDPHGEEKQYIAGAIGQKAFPVARRFLCAHCRKNLIRDVYAGRGRP